ncbi:MAG: permease-like cell division protein FtsX, partial [Clostridia bacterium]|nr:permease-like cell division protein FtsX [Clostridia bacterium]
LFLDDEVPSDRFAEIRSRIEQIENVAACEFISKEQAFEDYKATYAEEYDLYEDLEAQGINPLPNSFSVTMKDITIYEETIYQLSRIEGVARIRKQNQDTIDGMLSVAKSIYFICYWIMGLLFVASLFIIMNTIKIARFTNRRQINIMKFVGATDWFIRWPFIFEGAIIGLLAAVISHLFVWYTYTNVMIKLGETIRIFEILPFAEVSSQMLLVASVCGLLIGVLGSSISIRRYFDV